MAVPKPFATTAAATTDSNIHLEPLANRQVRKFHY